MLLARLHHRTNISSLNISPIDAHTAELHWPQSTDLDVRVGGTVEIRHTVHTDANLWGAVFQDIVNSQRCQQHQKNCSA